MKILNKKKKIQSFFIKKNSKIIDAISHLDKIRSKFLIVVNNENSFLGVLNDGDVRRGILKGYNIENSINKIYNKKPIVFNKQIDFHFAEKIFVEKKINFFPILKKKKS